MIMTIFSSLDVFHCDLVFSIQKIHIVLISYFTSIIKFHLVYHYFRVDITSTMVDFSII